MARNARATLAVRQFLRGLVVRRETDKE
jgi:hypothetical protein